MAIDRYTVEERCTEITLKRGFTVIVANAFSRSPRQPGRRSLQLLCTVGGDRSEIRCAQRI